MEKSRIYTKTGDKGFTSLANGKRVAKTDERIEAYGAVDELNSFTGCLKTMVKEKSDKIFLSRVQSILFFIGSCLSAENNEAFNKESLRYVSLLENEIDRIDAKLPVLKNFVLPGSSEGSAFAHICRTICRRAERNICRIKDEGKTNGNIAVFMNRLSDYFFVLSRKLCIESGNAEIIWDKSCL